VVRTLQRYITIALSLILFITLATFPIVSYAQSDEVQVELDPASGTVEDVFRYAIIVSGNEASSPPTLTPSEDFTAQYVGTSSNIEIINGATKSEVHYLFELTPRRAGTLKTPEGSVQVGGSTRIITPLNVPISRASGASSALQRQRQIQKQGVFLTRELSKKEVYEGEQLATTLKLYSKHTVAQGSFNELTYDDFWKENLGEPTAQTVRYSGEQYFLHQVSHALFPLRSGTLTIPPAALQLVVRMRGSSVPRSLSRFQLFDPDFFGMTQNKKLTVRSQPTRLTVKPLPAIPKALLSGLAHEHVAVGDLSVSLGYNTDSIELGESKTLTVTIQSTGNIRPIDKLTLKTPKWIKVYHDAPEEVVASHGSQFSLKKRFRLSLVPEKGGEVELPGITLLRFSPEKGEYERVTTRPIRFQVKGPDLAPASDQPIGDAQGGVRGEIAGEQPAQQTLYRFEEEGLLEKFSRTLTLPVSLFLFTVALLVVATIWLLVLLRRRYVESGLRTPAKNDLQRAATALELREAFIRELSAILGANHGESYRGYLLEQKLEEHIADQALRDSVTQHLDTLDSLSYGGSTPPEELGTLTTRSEVLIEHVREDLR
jgi:hypothetical protein